MVIKHTKYIKYIFNNLPALFNVQFENSISTHNFSFEPTHRTSSAPSINNQIGLLGANNTKYKQNNSPSVRVVSPSVKTQESIYISSSPRTTSTDAFKSIISYQNGYKTY